MAVPPFTADGVLPLGRYLTDLDELESVFVDDPVFDDSSTRGQIFEDFLSTIELLKGFKPNLIEAIWIGGSFVSEKLDPDDIDCLFLLSQQAHESLSNSVKGRVHDLNKKDRFRAKTGLHVEPFVLVRIPIANPWDRNGVHPDAALYTQVRGAWDDWWLRSRTGEAPGEAPRLASAEPRRGYLEVTS